MLPWYLMERMRSPTTMKSPRLCRYRHRMCPWCPHSVCQHQIAANFVMQFTPQAGFTADAPERPLGATGVYGMVW
jgi:hypothetical protein